MGMDVTPILWIGVAMVAVFGLFHARELLHKLMGKHDWLLHFLLVFTVAALCYWVAVVQK